MKALFPLDYRRIYRRMSGMTFGAWETHEEVASGENTTGTWSKTWKKNNFLFSYKSSKSFGSKNDDHLGMTWKLWRTKNRAVAPTPKGDIRVATWRRRGECSSKPTKFSLAKPSLTQSEMVGWSRLQLFRPEPIRKTKKRCEQRKRGHRLWAVRHFFLEVGWDLLSVGSARVKSSAPCFWAVGKSGNAGSSNKSFHSIRGRWKQLTLMSLCEEFGHFPCCPLPGQHGLTTVTFSLHFALWLKTVSSTDGLISWQSSIVVVMMVINDIDDDHGDADVEITIDYPKRSTISPLLQVRLPRKTTSCKHVPKVWGARL